MLEMLAVEEVTKQLDPLGYQRIEHIHGSTYKDCSTVCLIPTRDKIHSKVVQAWNGLIKPMNQKFAQLFVTGDEVGHAYNRMIQMVLDHQDLSKWKYVLTLEDDNLPPADALIRLLESIDGGRFDAVSGIYFTKGDWNMPQCYGDAAEYARTGVLSFQPLDIRQALANGNVMECNGIAMGCSLYRMELFKEIKAPWFVSVADVIPDKGPQCMTQDLEFCAKAKKAGKRFAVDFRVKVGHLDVSSGQVF